MNTAATTASKAVSTRSEIDAKYLWNLTDLYTSDDDWEKSFAHCQSLVKKAPAYSGTLAQSSQSLWECLELRSEVTLAVSRLYQYAHLNKDSDTRVSTYQGMTDRAVMLSSDAGAAFAFIEPELTAISDLRLNELAAGFSDKNRYDLYISELIRTRKHIRSTEVEELLAQSAVVARGPDSIYTMLNDADMKYPSITDEQGREVQLTKQRLAKFMESSNRPVRQAAYRGFYSTYQEHLNTCAASLAASVNGDVFYSRARKFDSCLESALFRDNIPQAVYRGLIETTESHLESLHRYFHLRRRILKLDDLHSWDLSNPLFPDQDYEIEYDSAVSEIQSALKPLGSDYSRLVEESFTRRWIDVFETQGKGSGAYSYGTYGKHPYILMNYGDTVDNQFTLAHEVGHAMHSCLSNANQPSQKAAYSIFVAEVASTLNEGLLLQYLLKRTDDPRKKLYLINKHIDDTIGTFFFQVMLAHFELSIHESVEHGEALTPDRLNEIYAGLINTYYGPALVTDEYSAIKWSRIPHFYNSFYVFQYATSFAASQAILKKHLDGDSGIVERYLTLLKSGGCDYTIALLKKCGVDMSTPEPVMATLDLFSSEVAELEKLAK